MSAERLAFLKLIVERAALLKGLTFLEVSLVLIIQTRLLTYNRINE